MHCLAVVLDWHLVLRRLFHPDSDFARALVATLYISIVSQVLGVLLGTASALAGMSRLLPLRMLSAVYVLVVRGTPIIVQIFFVYFGANLFLGFDLFPREATLLGLNVSGAVLAGIVALSINEGAYMSEIIRAGVGAIDRGQMEAAKSVGMRHGMAMRRIVLPQAARVIVPPLGNEFNAMLKASSLLAFIGVYELFQDAQVHYSTDFKPVEYFISVAIWYLVLTTIWGLIQVQIERRLGASDRMEDERWTTRFFGFQSSDARGIR
jgi:polar amino acid transport system permease protein